MHDENNDVFWAIFALGMIAGASILGAALAGSLLIAHHPHLGC